MIKVIVTIDDAHRSAMNEVAEGLHSKGMEIEQVLDAVGIITGDSPKENLPDLKDVDGVAAVDEEMQFQVRPPETEIE